MAFSSVAAAPMYHCQRILVTPPSGSDSSATNGIVTCGCRMGNVIAPASSILTIVTVTRCCEELLLASVAPRVML